MSVKLTYTLRTVGRVAHTIIGIWARMTLPVGYRNVIPR